MTAIIDIETDSEIPYEANLKFFGGLDCDSGEVTTFDYTQRTKIKQYIKNHRVLVGFNIKSFDRQVLEDYGVSLKYHIIVDLWECLAPREGDNDFGKYNKNRLHDINPELSLKNYKLKTLVEALKLDDQGKGNIDYKILKKNSWTLDEKKEIIKYLTQDLVITYKLFSWYRDIFKPLEPYLPEKDVEDFRHLTCTSGSLAYKVMCHRVGVPEEYNEREVANDIKQQSGRIEGGHHIHPRWEKVRGKIICRDFVSHYPHIIVMYNLLDQQHTKALYDILSERIQAKKKGDKIKALALKVPINSVYGLLGNPTFKNIYNIEAAGECTRLGRELLRRYAQTLDISNFVPLYGFTDSIYVGIPEGLTEEDLEMVTQHYIDTIKEEVINKVDSFGIGIENKMKFIWFIEKKDNNYLYVNEKDEIKIKGGLLDKNTPPSIIKLFNEYITPKIIKELDVNFTEEELVTKLREMLTLNPELSGEEYKVKDKSAYKLDTTLQYSISDRYGPGVHSLIPNTKMIGAGRGDDVRYCTLKEFKEAGLTVDDISIERMTRYLIPFFSTKEKVVNVTDLVQGGENGKTI